MLESWETKETTNKTIEERTELRVDTILLYKTYDFF